MNTFCGRIFSYSLTSDEVKALYRANDILLTLLDHGHGALQDCAQINTENGDNFLAAIDQGLNCISEVLAQDDRDLFVIE